MGGIHDGGGSRTGGRRGSAREGRVEEESVEVDVDAFPGVDIHGQVDSFSAATGARFALLPPDNASGNYTKIVQRMPVRVKLDAVPDGVTLRPGMSVEVVVDTRR